MIFNSYVKLPEGIYIYIYISIYNWLLNWLFQLVSPGLEPEGGAGGPWPSRSTGGSLSGAREAMVFLGGKSLENPWEIWKISGKSMGNLENLWKIHGKFGKSLENP